MILLHVQEPAHALEPDLQFPVRQQQIEIATNHAPVQLLLVPQLTTICKIKKMILCFILRSLAKVEKLFAFLRLSS